jgi:predicted ATPase/DNA-binding XRE family transcriptional regulator/Tfp pilus assembly protein PilF
MNQQITFAEWLKGRRRQLDLTQQALADRINCSIETIYKIEAGRRRPSTQIARLMGIELNIPSNELDAFIKFARSSEAIRINSPHVEITPWRDAFIPNNNLPLQLTELIGRESQLSKALNRLRQEDVRLLTLVGPPGIGKTRQAIQLGNDALLDFPDGVFFVELASISQADRLVQVITRTLDIALAAHKKPLKSLQDYLYERHLLLILDNFEQILDAAQDVRAILATCPLVKIVVTSRAPLRVRGERQFQVEPLTLPAHGHDLTVRGLAGFSAVQLFVRRAQAVLADFELTATNAAIIAALCARVDGLPLAIEIVAAQIAVLNPEEILDRLAGKTLLDSPGASDSDPRHRSLTAAINWSYRLLDDPEQRFFRSIGVFVDGFTLDAAQQIGQPQQESLLVLSKLVGMNLLKRETDTSNTSRYRLLDVIRQYAQRELRARNEWQALQQRHADYCLEFVQTYEKYVRTNGQVAGLERFEREHNNLLAALDCFIDTEDWEKGLQLAGYLTHFWVYRNYILIGLHYIKALLAATDNESGLERWRATVLNGASMLAYFAGEYPLVEQYSVAALATAQAVESYRNVAWAYTSLGMANGGMGNFEEATRYFQKGLDATQHADLPQEEAGLLNGFGEVARSQGQFDSAHSYFEHALTISRRIGNLWIAAHILDNMGHAAYSQGQYEAAQRRIRESMEASIALGDERGIAMCLEKLAGIALKRSQPEYAATLLGVADSLRKAKNTPVEGMDVEDYNQIVADLHEQFPSERIQAAWQAAQHLSLSQIIKEVLDS